MNSEESNAQNRDSPPVVESIKPVGETKKVDTKVQEEAAKQREENGGYQ